MLPSKNGGPSAFRTPLGWYVVGLFTKLERESSISYNQIIAQGADTRKTSGKVKHINAKQMLENTCKTYEVCEIFETDS